MVLGVSPSGIPAAVPLPQMPGIVNRLTNRRKDSLAPAQATEECCIAKAENTIDMKREKVMKAITA